MVKGGMHGERGACMAKGVFVAKGGCVWYACPLPFYEIWPVNVQAVCILLECILVRIFTFCSKLSN